MRLLRLLFGFGAAILVGALASADPVGRTDYQILATNRTATMEDELNRAAARGYRFSAVHGGETAFGGGELVVAIERDLNETPWPRFDYRVLATNRTSTMEGELNHAASFGFRAVGQAVLETEFGGHEVVVIIERDLNDSAQFEYALLATTRTSTMQRELADAGRRGFRIRGLSVGVTSFGGQELVAVVERPLAP